MSQIRVNNLTFCYEGSFDNIFEDVSFSVDTNWKLGFIGRNGKGKTTFLNLLLGKYEYEGSIQASVVFDYFPYPVTERQRSLPAAEFLEEWKAGCELWRVLCELEELRQDPEVLYRPFQTLSPGERTKIMLAVLFSGENDFLLIDEPTNHLDQESRENVKRYLASKKGFILVSHDRELLDACIDHVLVLNRQSIEVQSGNFSSWWENKSRKDQFAVGENEKHLKEIGKLRKSVARTGQWADKSEQTKIGFYRKAAVNEHERAVGMRAYIGSKTKKMQSRVKQMEKRINREIEEKEGLLVDLEQPVDLKIMPMEHYKRVLVKVEDYSVWYEGAKEPVFSGVTFSVEKGERVVLHGENGCGKSTLLKMILKKTGGWTEGEPGWKDSRMKIGEIKADEIETMEANAGEAKAGEAKAGETGVCETGICQTASGLVVSYVSQDTSMLKGGISRFCMERGLDESLFCAILRQLDMERVQFAKNMEEYSEGQKKKILLAASLMTPAHLYVWDEPLNYIDVFSRMQIEKLLEEYQPTMLFVEHDARFREKVATRVVEL
ncbi:MAG: ABC-F family ATP-binding cassette domain-containing protein [Hungatella sp.]|nr:ABC-F family ATP-binding cassette domain-containing protein [Hungatella sp.]